MEPGLIRFALLVILTWLYIFLAGIPGVVYRLVTGKLDWLYLETRWGIRMLLRLGGIRVVEFGRDNVVGSKIGIFMANHQSNLDPPVLIACLPGQISVLAKKELFRIPLLGMLFRIGGLIPVDRSNREAARASVDLAVTALRSGRPFLVFPEGTRSADGRLLPFKKGTFVLAQRAEAPIYPVTIRGTREILPKGKLELRPGQIELHYHPPVFPANFADRDALIAAVRASIASVLPEEAVDG